jgi:hypothetical protein
MCSGIKQGSAPDTCTGDRDCLKNGSSGFGMGYNQEAKYLNGEGVKSVEKSSILYF